MITGNVLLHTDVYKMGHMVMYPAGLTKIHSYLQARSTKKYPHTVFFGLRYLIDEYLDNPALFPTVDDVEEFMNIKDSILGPIENDPVREKLLALVELGYWPIKIEAVPEGTVLPVGNLMATFESTHPDFPWVVGFLESLFLKLWNTCTVATASREYRDICLEYARKYADDSFYVNFQIHDFGYRGASSEETAMLSGMAHLINFFGTDTVPAVWGAMMYYNADPGVGLSVPASEHSVMCAYGMDKEIDAFRTIMETFPSGILSLVSDTYDLWNVLEVYARRLKDQIMARSGAPINKVVFRPDGGYPPYIVAGDPTVDDPDSPWAKGAIQILDEVFGSTVNSKGLKVLHPSVGLIYGEGMTRDRVRETFDLLIAKGYSPENVVFGVGGLLLQAHNRDDMDFALKAVYAEVDGEHRDLQKNPVTSRKKASKKGRQRLITNEDGTFETLPWHEGEPTGLELYYLDGKTHHFDSFADIRQRVQAALDGAA